MNHQHQTNHLLVSELFLPGFTVQQDQQQQQEEKEVTVPTAFRLFKFGANESSKGTFLMDDQSLEQIMSVYSKQKNKLSIDYDHASLNPNPIDPAESGKAAGNFRLRVDPGTKELWAMDVVWTSLARQKLLAGEFKYISPAFTTQEKDNRIVRILNVALTNNPALYDLPELLHILSSHGSEKFLTAPIVTKTNTHSPSRQQQSLLGKTKKTNMTMNAPDPQAVNKTNDEELTEVLTQKNHELELKLQKLTKNQTDTMILSAIKETRLDPKFRKYAESVALKEGVEGLQLYLSTLTVRENSNHLLHSQSSSDLTQGFTSKDPTSEAETLNPSDENEEKKSNNIIQLSERDENTRKSLGISKKKYIKNVTRLTITTATKNNFTAKF